MEYINTLYKIEVVKKKNKKSKSIINFSKKNIKKECRTI